MGGLSYLPFLAVGSVELIKAYVPALSVRMSQRSQNFRYPPCHYREFTADAEVPEEDEAVLVRSRLSGLSLL